MNHQSNPNGQSPRVADYFVIVGTTDELVPVPYSSDNTHSTGPKRLRMQFEPSIIDQYPLRDRKDSPFPSGVPLFCFPDALEIYTESNSPCFFSFVQTSESGAHILGCCLVLYEPITTAARANLVAIYESAGLMDLMEVAQKGKLLVPKCLCIISTWPFIENFKKILCQLYRISLSPSMLPLERYICNFLDDVPAPPPGRVAIDFYMGDLAVSFRCPPTNRPIVWNSFPVDPLFECLSLSNVMLVFSAILAERQIILVSTQYSLLTTCAEVLTSLMYPLRWSHAYIPILPKALLGVLGAPVPFLVGVHTDFLESVNCCIPEEAVVVFIDDNRVELGALGTPPALPEGRGKKLHNSLIPLVSSTFDNRLTSWKTTRLPYFDLAFNMSIRPDLANGTLEQGKSNIDEQALREAFLKFFVAIMKNYRKYLIYPSQETPNPLVNFQQKDFIADHPSDWSEFLKSVLPTQAFCQFCDARISSSSLKDADIRFFDESIEAKHNRYMFKFFSVDTPFLNDQTSKHVKTIVAAAPNVEGLPGYSSHDMDSDVWLTLADTHGGSATSVLSAGSNDSHNSTSSAGRAISNAIAGAIKASRSGSVGGDESALELPGRRNSGSALGRTDATQQARPGKAKSQKGKAEHQTYVYDNFPRLKAELYAPSRDGMYAVKESPYQNKHTKKELRELKENPYTAAPLKSNDAVADLFSNKLKRIPHYKHRMQGFTEGVAGMFTRSNSSAASRQRSLSAGPSWFTSSNNKSDQFAAQRNFSRRGSAGVDSSFSETASEENANACTHNAFLTLLCFVISKNKSLPAVRRAPPATTKLINEYGKGISDALRGSVASYPDDEGSSFSIRRTYSASVSTNAVMRNSVAAIRRSTSGIQGDDKAPVDATFGRGVSDNSDADFRESLGSLDLSTILSPPKTGGLPNSGHFNAPDIVAFAAEYETADDGDRDSCRSFKHMSDNIREETLVASKAGLKMAFEVLFVMTEKGLPPDELTYRSLAECCAVCGDGHCAIDLLEDMLYWGYLPDPDITSSVVQAMLHSSARDISYSSDASESFPGQHHSTEKKYGANFVTAKDVLDAVNANDLSILRERLEARIDDDVHTYASKLSAGRRPKSKSASHTWSRDHVTLKAVTSTDSLKSLSNSGVEDPRVATSQTSSGAPKVDIAEANKAAPNLKYSPSKKVNAGGSSTPVIPSKKVDFYLDTVIEPASSRLMTHNLLADRILDMQFPHLQINLNDPFGTYCPHPKCGKSHTMAQLRAGWDGVDPNKYTTKCVHCSREFVPRFTVHSSCSNWLIEDVDLLCGNVPDDYGTRGSPELLWCELLSPWVLRKELLMILLNDGIDRVLSASFRKPSPSNNQNSVIFWNMIVAFRGCGLPYQFMISETLSTAFLVPLGDPSY